MSDGKKEGGLSAKIVGGIAAGIGTIIVAVLTAQNVPWWFPKPDSSPGGSSKPSNPEQQPSLSQQSPTPPQSSAPTPISPFSPPPTLLSILILALPIPLC